MSVGTFDPKQLAAEPQAIDEALLQLAVAAAHRQAADVVKLTLSDDEVMQLQPLLTHQGWRAAAPATSPTDLVPLIRLFTLGEGQYSSWQAGAKSPVVALVRALKKNGGMTAELTAWIKRNTDNRYLPHGDLMDRL